jgi:[acyl-carrier-protein] S-malonyltransferase
MEPAYYGIKAYLENFSFKKSKVPVISNVTGMPMSEPDEIKENITNQIVSPVMWEDSMRFMLNEGVDVFIELGPGSVLKGLLKRIDKNAVCLGIDKADDLDELSKIFN